MKKRFLIITALLITALVMLGVSTSVFAKGITGKNALKKALRNAKLSKSKVRAIEVELEHGKYEIEFVRKSNKTEYDYEISAKNGRILEKSVDYNLKYKRTGKKISKCAARKKAAKASGVKLSTLKKGTCRYKKGKYEVKFKTKKRRYEYEINASNKKILEYEWELICR